MTIEESAKELVAVIWRPSSNEVRVHKAKIMLQAERDDMREMAAKRADEWHLPHFAKEIRDLK